MARTSPADRSPGAERPTNASAPVRSSATASPLTPVGVGVARRSRPGRRPGRRGRAWTAPLLSQAITRPAPGGDEQAHDGLAARRRGRRPPRSRRRGACRPRRGRWRGRRAPPPPCPAGRRGTPGCRGARPAAAGPRSSAARRCRSGGCPRRPTSSSATASAISAGSRRSTGSGKASMPASLCRNDALGLEGRQRRLGAQVALAHDRAAVAHDHHAVALDGVVPGLLEVVVDGHAHARHAGRVGHREVVAGGDRHAVLHAHLAADVREEAPGR